MLHSMTAVKTAVLHMLLPGVLLAVAVSMPVRSDVTDFLVNDDGGSAQQSSPRIAVAGDGTFVVAWADRREGNSDIYLQRYDAFGNPLGGNFRINDDSTGAHQSEPSIAVDLSGLFSLVWKDFRQGEYPFGPDIYFQRFDTAVSVIGENLCLTAGWPDSLKESPDIALAHWGSGVVVWADYRDHNWDIYGQRFSSDGGLIGSKFKINDDVNFAQQHAPRISVAPEGWFVVTWYDNRWGNDDIFVQHFDSLGSALGPNVRVNSDGAEVRQAFPDVAADGAGHFTVVWVDWRNGTYPSNPDLYARKYDTSMVPRAAEERVNRDGTRRAQREPTIAADRMGNVAIIWSDSTGSSWDITGQMIDVEGVIRETNFQANSFGDSAQLQPDVALDGRYRYVTWADRRQGNWDVFASITRYNDPTLVPVPSALKFEMELGGPLPEVQELRIEHTGYNALHFVVHSSVQWCLVTPDSGLTPAGVTVSVSGSSFDYGTHFGTLTLVDLHNQDSTSVVSVRLDVTVAELALSTDTVRLRAMTGLTDSVVGYVEVSNSGAGSFTWTAAESAPWLSLSDASGAPPSTVELIATAASLAEGLYAEPVVFRAEGALGSPDTVWVTLEVTAERPYLAVSPESFYVQTAYPGAVAETLVVENKGSGTLNWNATVADSWLQADRLAGGSGDTIHLAVDTLGLTPGSHETSIEITDTSSIIVSLTVPFVLEVLELSETDTLRLGSAQMETGGSAAIPVELHLLNRAREIQVPIMLDPVFVSIQSVEFDPVIVSQASVAHQIDSSLGLVLLSITAVSVDDFVETGEYQLARLRVTARDRPGVFPVDTARFDSLSVCVVTDRDGSVTPVVIPGQVTVDTPTELPPELRDELPRATALSQNFPNPFNLSTGIEFELPATAEVRLEVYNILGQKVRVLAGGLYSVGGHVVQWDGMYENGQVAPSGIYFYRLRSGPISLVRKMVLVK